MQKCPNCNAPLSGDVELCQFCGSVTDAGVRAKQQRAQQQSAEGQAARARAQPEIDSAANWALASSIIGTVVCCLVPVGPVMGLVFGARARKLARQHGLPVGGKATAGYVLGQLGVGLAIFAWLGVAGIMINEHRRNAALHDEIAKVGETLDLQGACALTELELLERRHEGFTAIMSYECAATGDLVVEGTEATLQDTRIRKDNGDKVEVTACLRRLKSTWVVKQLADCQPPAANH